MDVPEDRGGHIWPKDRETFSRDGTRIRYTVRGPEDAPWVVLCAGFVCPDNFWTFLVPELEETCRVAILNYRGVGASGLPRPIGPLGRNVRSEDYTVERHAEDVIAVMAAEAIEDAALVGHSMGTQVALEVYRRLGSERIAGIALVTGPYRSPLHTFYGSSLAAKIFPVGYLAVSMLPNPVLRVVPKIAELPGAFEIGRLIRATGPRTPKEHMRLWLEHLAELDAAVMMRVAKGMHHHDASDLLDKIEVPVLVIAASKDTFTPPRVGKRMSEQIPDCEIVFLPEATHCALIEHPDEVNSAIHSLLRRSFSDVG